MRKNLLLLCMLSFFILSCKSENQKRMDAITEEVILLNSNSENLLDNMERASQNYQTAMDQKIRMVGLDPEYKEDDEKIKDLKINLIRFLKN